MTDHDQQEKPLDQFLVGYQPSELRIASEFLTTWLSFLSKDLCQHCSTKLADRVLSLGPELDDDSKQENPHENSIDLASTSKELQGFVDNDTTDGEDNLDDDTNSLLSWKDDGADGSPEAYPEASSSGLSPKSPSMETPSPRMSWADMAHEDELEEEEDRELNKRVVNVTETGGLRITKPTLSREQREKFRFMNVRRKKDFICLERVNGKPVNILDGLELHTGIFSAAEQKRIVDSVYSLQERGRKGELKARTYTAPQKWMKGKGRVTIQFGCCYNYAVDKYGNPPGILKDDVVDPLPDLFKVIIRRLVKWHVLPPSCVPDSCIVNIYEEGDCIPPHIDNHDFVRPFCTVSFLSECNILFGLNLKAIAAGEFEGSFAIPLPVGSVLVLNGRGADVAKHCVPAVPTKRISITFRRMDESKRPNDYIPIPGLQNIQPLSFEDDKTMRSNTPRGERQMNRQSYRRAGNSEMRGSSDRSVHSEPRDPNWSRCGSAERIDVYLKPCDPNWSQRGSGERRDMRSEPRDSYWSQRGSALRRDMYSEPRDSNWGRRRSGNRWNRGRVNVNTGS